MGKLVEQCVRAGWLATALMVVPAAAWSAAPAPPIGPSRIEAAIATARDYLASAITDDGSCTGEYGHSDSRHLHGGKTALCVYALLRAGADEAKPPVSRAIKWLSQAKLEGTYAVAMRACAYAAMKDPKTREALAKDVAWLIRAAHDGAYTYGPRSAGDPYDNSNSQMAVLGVWAGARRGVKVPAEYWRSVEVHWTNQQQADGGWGYFVRPRALSTKTYGSMTAAGLATMYVCFDTLRREQFVRCTAPSEYKPVEDALEWLARRFAASENPGKGIEWYHYWLYSLQRVALASGYRYFGGRDWYALGTANLLASQNVDGSWGYGDRTVETAFALLFLAKGNEPIAFNKLRYDGRWNARPRDMANLARWLSYTFERPVNWQIVDLDSPVADWHDAPILYLSGAGPMDLSDAQVDKLRQFVYEGGTILSEAAGNNANFTLDVQKLHRRLLPTYPAQRLPEDHPIYSVNFAPHGLTGLSAVSNGIRLLAIHSPHELSLALQLADAKSRRQVFELAANVYLYVTDKGVLRPRGTNVNPSAKPFDKDNPPRAVIRVARIKHEGNCNPEPLAWQRLATRMAARHRALLSVGEPMDMAKLDAAKWHVAAMTGTGSFVLDDRDTEALKAFLADGGTLVVDAAGGAKSFVRAVEEQILPLLGDGVRGPVVSDHQIYATPEKVQKIAFRRDFAISLGAARNQPRLIGIDSGGRVAVFFSREDLTAALVGYAGYGIRGYTPDVASQLMTNILFYAAGIAPEQPAQR